MDVKQVALDLIGSIYDAANDPELWPSVLEQTRHVFRARAVTFILYDNGNVLPPLRVGLGFDMESLQEHQEKYLANDPLMQFAMRQPLLVPGLSHQAVSPALLRETDVYQEFYRPKGVFWCVFVNLFKDKRFFGSVGWHRAEDASPFGEDEHALLELLAPHLQRALQLHTRIAALEGRWHAAQSVFDQLPLGIGFAGHDARVMYLNRSAQSIVDERDGLSLSGSSLRAARATDTAELRTLMQDTAATARGEGMVAGGVRLLDRPSGRRPLSMLVSPIHGGPPWLGGGDPAVALFLGDPDLDTDMPAQRLERLYGLTPSEAAISELMARGRSVGNAARELGITQNTARTHLKRVFAKTETARQAELVRLLTTGPAALRPEDAPLNLDPSG